MYAQNNGLLTPRIDPRHIKRDQANLNHEFQLTFKPQPEVSASLIMRSQLLDTIPALGRYADPYVFLPRLALLELEPALLKNALPPSLQQALIKAVGPFDAMINTKTVYAHAMISGFKSGDIVNIVFHPFVYTYVQQPFYNQNILMGLFDAHGISRSPSESISIDHFSMQNVNAHNGVGYAYSPNNAQFLIIPHRLLGIVWSAAVSPDKQHIAITFHIILHCPVIEKHFSALVKQAQTYGDLLNALQETAQWMKNSTPRSAEAARALHLDVQALESAITTLHQFIGGTPITDPLASIKTDLAALHHQLNQLQTNASLLP